jgi:hypothetical protein
MFKFLIYLLLSYLVYRYFFRPKVLDRQPPRDSLHNDPPKNDAREKDGDYVDYEEIK